MSYLKSASFFERLLKQSHEKFQQVLKKANKLENAVCHGGICIVQPREINWVMGNEAADLDSIISSLSFALLSSRLAKNDTPLTLPLINLPRDDINLRPEALHVFNECHVPVDLLLFIDDPLVIQWSEIASQPDTKSNFILVDHNKLHSRFNSWNGEVKAIYDHHEDEKAHQNANPRVIRPVGSNTSLIVEWWNQQNNDLQDNMLSDLAMLMLAPILVDTVNLRGEYGRVTNLDIEMSELLCELLKSTTFKGTDTYFQEIDAAKINVSQMSPSQLLRRDFKLWTTPITSRRLGMSSIVNWALNDWSRLHSQSPELAMKKFAALHDLDLLVVMGSKQDPDFKRDLYFYTPDMTLFNHLTENLPLRAELGLTPCEVATQAGFAFYIQGVISSSRKVTFPIFRDLLDALPSNPRLSNNL